MTHDEALRLADAGLCLMPAQVRALCAQWRAAQDEVQVLRGLLEELRAATENTGHRVDAGEHGVWMTCTLHDDAAQLLSRVPPALETER